MRKLFLLPVIALMLVGCGKDRVEVYNNNDRVALLEARASLNEANDSLLEARVTSLEGRMNTVESRLDGLDERIDLFEGQMAHEIGLLQDEDADLAQRLNVHTVAITALAGQVVLLHAKDFQLNNKITALQGRVSALESEIQTARGSYPNLNARLNNMLSSIGTLQGNVTSLQANVAALNTFAALQTITNGYIFYQMSLLDQRIENNSDDISSLITQVNNLKNKVKTITNAQGTGRLDVLEDQVGGMLSDYVTHQELADAIAAVELLEGPQGPAGNDGADGQDGQDGLAGAPGPQGQPGINGSTAGMSAVKLCSADNATHPEYGFVVGDSIYAVYYGVVGGTLSAFLARLNPGTYVTTNDNTPCSFTVSYSGGNSYLDGVQVNPVVTPPVVVPPANTLAGSCSVAKSGSNYVFTLTGVAFDNAAVLTLSHDTSLHFNSDSRGNWTRSTPNNNTTVYTVTHVGATTFTFYPNGSGILNSAIITRGGQTLTCTGLPN